MSRAVTPTQTLETRRVPQDLATLLAQRDELSGAFALPGHRDREDLLRFFPSRRPQKAGKRRAMRAASCVWPTPWRLATPKAIRSHRS